MPADTHTPLLALLLQGTGNNSGTWGDEFNTNVVQLLEDAIAGSHSIVTTGGTTTLTAAQARKATLVVTGALVSNAIIVVPNVGKTWVAINQTTGSFTVTIKTAAGTATSLPVAGNSAIRFVVCDGSDHIYVST